MRATQDPLDLHVKGSPSSGVRHLEIRCALPCAAITLRSVHGPDARLVRSLLDGERTEAGAGAMSWDLKDATGQRVTSGVYSCKSPRFWTGANGT